MSSVYMKRERSSNVLRYSTSNYESSLLKDKSTPSFQESLISQALCKKSNSPIRKQNPSSTFASFGLKSEALKVSKTPIRIRNLQMLKRITPLRLPLKGVWKAREAGKMVKTMCTSENETSKLEINASFLNAIKALQAEYETSISKIRTLDSELQTKEKYELCKQLFEKFVSIDYICGGVLRAIKNSYDSYIDSLLRTDAISRLSPELLDSTDFIQKAGQRTVKETQSEAAKLVTSLTKELTYPKLSPEPPQESLKPHAVKLPTRLHQNPSFKPMVPCLVLPLNGSQPEFHKEFTANYSEFSPSWRKLLNEERKT